MRITIPPRFLISRISHTSAPLFRYIVAAPARRPIARYSLGTLLVGLALAISLTGKTASAQTETATESVLSSFCGGGAQCPYEVGYLSLIQASDGLSYGINQEGGANLSGSIFLMNQAGAVSTLYSFCSQGGTSCTDGSNPIALIQGGDGNFYGVTSQGGAYASGTLFKFTSSGGRLTTLYNFCSQGGSACSDGAYPTYLVQGSGGNFYGATLGSSIAGIPGTVFKITSSGTLTTLYKFCTQGGPTCPDGAGPSVLVQGSDGNLYGITQEGGSSASGNPYGSGTIFKLTPSGQLTTLYTFCASGQCSDGYVPYTLSEAADGSFYGTTQYGGSGGYSSVLYGSGNNLGGGTVFKLTPSGTLSTLYSFCSESNCDDGGWPLAMIEGSDGNFYGMNNRGGSGTYGLGTAFELTPMGSLNTLYNFCPVAVSECADGISPLSLTQGSDGNLYGGSGNGGIYQDGAVFKLTLSPALSAPVKLSFSEGQIALHQSTTLSWKVLNGASATMQQCYAFVQGGITVAGTWTGLQTGTASNGVYSSSAVITPTAEGAYTYAMTCGGVESGFATLTVGPAQPLSISTTSLPNAVQGSSYAQTLAATGGVPPYLWSLSSGSLPAGLTLSANSGAIDGTPTSPGTEAFAVEVKDSAGTPDTATANLSITVNPPPVAITTASLPAGTQGTAYSQELSTTGGVSPYLWSLTSGSLPAGLTLNSSSGVISGTPTATGAYSFTVKAQDSESTPQTATANLSITINLGVPALTISPASLTFAAQDTGSSGAAQTVTLTNSGTAALNLASIAVSGDFAETNNCGSSLPASGSCTVSITFTPTTGGTRAGVLTMTDNAGGSPQTMALTGTGSTMTLTPSASSLNIASPGASATAAIQLASVGGFSGMADLACAVAYQGSGTAADTPTCSLNPDRQQVPGTGTVSTALTVNTTASTSARMDSHPFLRLGGGAISALLLFMGAPARRRRKWAMLVTLCLAIVGSCMGCAGRSGSSPSNPGTTTGNYMVSVTATSGTVTASVTLPLKVQ